MSVLLVFSRDVSDVLTRDVSGCGQFHLVPRVTAGRPSPPWDGDVFSGRVLITHKIMAIARTIGRQEGKIVWREVNRGWVGGKKCRSCSRPRSQSTVPDVEWACQRICHLRN